MTIHSQIHGRTYSVPVGGHSAHDTELECRHFCRHFDLSTPLLIFGGLFLVSAAFCAMEASSSLLTEEVGVIIAEDAEPIQELNPISYDCGTRGEEVSDHSCDVDGSFN